MSLSELAGSFVGAIVNLCRLEHVIIKNCSCTLCCSLRDWLRCFSTSITEVNRAILKGLVNIYLVCLTRDGHSTSIHGFKKHDFQQICSLVSKNSQGA